jgi:substrate import-associated zinc metallohydrolase lipoprotein
VQKIWLDSYKAIAGADFVKTIAPREFVLVGGINLNTTGTITLGLAEGGQRITLFETDNVNKKDRANVKRFVQTIQHEYIHILNQTRPFDEKNTC